MNVYFFNFLKIDDNFRVWIPWSKHGYWPISAPLLFMLFYNPIVYINRDVNGWFHKFHQSSTLESLWLAKQLIMNYLYFNTLYIYLMNTQIVLRCITINSKKNYISIISLYQSITKFLKVNWREVFHAYSMSNKFDNFKISRECISPDSSWSAWGAKC